MIKSRYLLACLLVFAFTSAVLPAQKAPAQNPPPQTSEEWQKYKNTDFNFSISFPCTPKSGPIPGSESAPSLLASCIVDQTAYMAIVQANSQEVALTDEAFEAYSNGFFKVMQDHQIVKEEAASPSLPESIGRLYHYSFAATAGQRINAIGNLYLRKRSAYGILVAYPESSPEPAAAKKFLGAFTLLDPTK